MGDYTIPSLYNAVYNMKQTLEGGEEGEPIYDRDFINTYGRRACRPRDN